MQCIAAKLHQSKERNGIEEEEEHFRNRDRCSCIRKVVPIVCGKEEEGMFECLAIKLKKDLKAPRGTFEGMFTTSAWPSRVMHGVNCIEFKEQC